MHNYYAPEGANISASTKGCEQCATIASLEHAYIHNTILEGTVTMCDSNFDLHINLGECEGIIKREEVMLCFNEEKIKDIAILTRVGKTVCFKVLGFKKHNNRIIAMLSRKEAQKDCYNNYLSRLSPGDIIPARVTHLENFGAFVDIGCGIISLLSVDCISISRISHPRDRLSCGMNIMTVIKSIDRSTGRIYVTHRELLGTWEQNAARFAPGLTVSGVVRSIEQYGIFIELAPNLAGLAESRESKDAHNLIEIGHHAAVYIKNIIPERMKIKLVLIDVHKSAAHFPSPPEYFIDTANTKHIDRWLYSPNCSERVIETVFS